MSIFTSSSPEKPDSQDKDDVKESDGLLDAADSVCTTPDSWTPPEVFDSLVKEAH